VVTFAPPGVDRFTGSTGLPVPGTDVRLLDRQGRDVAPGDAGEVCVKGPQVMRNYSGQPPADAATFTTDGYLKTGDIGVFDDAGFLKIVDRKKDMVLVSGFNVYPNEIDAVASNCPGVAECACIGVADDKTGEALLLFIVAAAGSALRAEDVIAHCRTALTAYKVPKIVRLVESLPKSAVGKILRHELLRQAQPDAAATAGVAPPR
jgi:long-chain acyl-CoA synthetase